ncbi:MAG: BolA family transcriptional regulator [Rickettsiales bacterium]|nr:BolA family transcriptional regulator [Rickettsiales bacterium]
MVITEEYLIDKIKQHVSVDDIQVVDQSAAHKGHAGYREGGGSHFNMLVVSQDFEGLSQIKRHQKIYAVLKEEMKEAIHALSIKALTPSEAAS